MSTAVAPHGFLPIPTCISDTSTCRAVTQYMLNFLNITDQNTYFQHYCMNPPSESCDFGKFCPNGDIFGAFTRLSNYITNIALSLTILHSPEDILPSFYTQLISVYSLLCSTIISITNGSLTRLDANMALLSVASPLTVYLIFYALRSMFRNENRMSVAFNPNKDGTTKLWWLNRIVVLAILPAWIGVLVYSVQAWRQGKLSQVACEDVFPSESLLLFVFVLPLALHDDGWQYELGFFMPLLLILITLIICVILRRKEIWGKGSAKVPFRRMWRVVMDNYPFVQFCTVVFIPFILWMLNVEVGATLSHGNNHTASFGQVLSLFVAVPPVFTLLSLLPRLPLWFINLWWVRLLTCRLRHRRESDPVIPDFKGYREVEKGDECI